MNQSEKKKTGPKTKWTEEYVLSVLDNIAETVDQNKSVLNVNKRIQPKYIALWEVCRDMGVSSIKLSDRMAYFIKHGEQAKLIHKKRKAIDDMLCNAVSSGATRDELNATMAKQYLVNRGEVSERTENKNTNYTMNVNLSNNFDSNQLGELLDLLVSELSEMESFMEYRKTVKSIGRPKQNV